MIKNVHGNTVDHLGQAIVAGRYGPGAPIPPEPMLCEELGVSRERVRQLEAAALARLRRMPRLRRELAEYVDSQSYEAA